ncbi:hypothetical protein PGTUg99_000685 [Puccinia graminis f. sp. tritici]|uniref:Uncharacterized protein n=1 Tax=Puccinia graminis f. sp. tritici TaxID=56615 RepID=A0A5B0RYH1_PUCGR|nr:hypothetical protein PGTUg99_000685 [Puccinia graminis f. sp. tritici]
MQLPANTAFISRRIAAFLATVVGWHFYLSSRSRNYGSPQTPDNYPHMSHRCHMPFFEYGRSAVDGKGNVVVNRSTLSIVQGLILLGAFPAQLILSPDVVGHY